jgi:hypothetical protein
MKIFQCGHCAQSFFLKATLVKIVAIYQVLEIVRCLLSNLVETLISDREQIEYRYCKTKNTTYVQSSEKGFPEELSSLSTKSNDTEPF